MKVAQCSILGKVGQLPSVALGGTTMHTREGAVAAAAANDDSEEDDMERRLQALRS